MESVNVFRCSENCLDDSASLFNPTMPPIFDSKFEGVFDPSKPPIFDEEYEVVFGSLNEELRQELGPIVKRVIDGIARVQIWLGGRNPGVVLNMGAWQAVLLSESNCADFGTMLTKTIGLVNTEITSIFVSSRESRLGRVLRSHGSQGHSYACAKADGCCLVLFCPTEEYITEYFASAMSKLLNGETNAESLAKRGTKLVHLMQGLQTLAEILHYTTTAKNLAHSVWEELGNVADRHFLTMVEETQFLIKATKKEGSLMRSNDEAYATPRKKQPPDKQQNKKHEMLRKSESWNCAHISYESRVAACSS